MLATIRGLALEVNTRSSKNDSTKRYSSLLVFEFGQQYPELKKVSLKEEQVPLAQSLCGQMVDIVADVFVYDNRTSLNLREATAIKKAA